MATVPPAGASVSNSPTETIRAANWRLPKLSSDDVVVAGLASGLAAELGVRARWLRVAFVVLFALAGLGGVVYIATWALLRWAEISGVAQPRQESIGLRGRSDAQRLLAVALITAGIAIGGTALQPSNSAIGFGVGFVSMGLGLAWRTSSTDQTEMPGRTRIRQLFGGLAAVVGGLALILYQIQAVPFLLGAGVVALFGTIIVAGPWLYGMVSDYDAERQARIRSDERAEVAAHIHDSVLQTLAMIQKVEDPQTARNLARKQERELRNWLDPDRVSRVGGSIRGHLDQLVSEVEELHGVPVEVVAVGDALVDAQINALLKAAREACMNAARHSGTPRIDLFLEVTDDRVELFVRDTGKGFDPDTIAADRRGLSQSIIGRMKRAGGTATIQSEVGMGTEVELTLDREPGRE